MVSNGSKCLAAESFYSSLVVKHTEVSTEAPPTRCWNFLLVRDGQSELLPKTSLFQTVNEGVDGGVTSNAQ